MSRNVHGHCGLENRAGKNDPPGGCLVSCGFIFGLRREARCVEYGIMAVRHMNSAELNASLKYLLTNYTNRVFNLLSGLHIMNVEQVIRRTSGMEVARMNNAIPMNAANALEAGKKRPGRKAAEGNGWKTIWLKISAVSGRAWDSLRNSLRSGSASRWQRYPNGNVAALSRTLRTSWTSPNSFTYQWMR